MTEIWDGLLRVVAVEGPLRGWLAAIFAFFAALILLKLSKGRLLAMVRRLADRTENDLDDVLTAILEGIRQPFFYLSALYLGGFWAPLPAWGSRALTVAFMAVVAFEVVIALHRLTDYAISRYMDGRTKTGEMSGHQAAVMKAAGGGIKGILWVLAVVLLLSNMGINVSSLLAGVGIGGIAIALAAQSVLSDVFSSFSIYADKPFEVGDFIVIGNDGGTVEYIGLKSTRIMTLQGEQMVVPNRELTQVRIQNFRKMRRRRVVMNFGVVYGLPADKLQAIPEMVRQAVEKNKEAEMERCHLSGFGNSGLEYEVVFFVNSPDYIVYMDIRQRINLDLYVAFEGEGIGFAYPTQTIHLSRAE
ncbi:mechanosensitive ion channel family protein [Candidatus Uhrbacteria bacterium]|nr:mechanosensitive ion channel family protein [Candidatus Uhrbacteria bacterium]